MNGIVYKIYAGDRFVVAFNHKENADWLVKNMKAMIECSIKNNHLEDGNGYAFVTVKVWMNATFLNRLDINTQDLDTIVIVERSTFERYEKSVEEEREQYDIFF